MKKSLLLSSIMALVLVIALSTATFAWYGSSREAKATMATLEASSGAGNLQISDDGETWTNNLSIPAPTNAYFVPASIKPLAEADNTTTNWNLKDNWFMGSKNADGSNTITAVNTANTYLLTYDIYVKNAGAEEVTVTLDKDALNFVSAYTGTDNTIIRASNQLAGQAAYMIFKDNVVYANSDYLTTESTSATSGVAVAKKEAEPFALAAGATTHFVVYNWIDGWQASSEGDTNSQRGQIKLIFNFSIPNNTQTAPKTETPAA